MALGGLAAGLLIAAAVVAWRERDPGQPHARPTAMGVPPGNAPAVVAEPVPPAAFAVAPTIASPPTTVPTPAASSPLPRSTTSGEATNVPSSEAGEDAAAIPLAPTPERLVPTVTASGAATRTPSEAGAGPREGDLPWSTVGGQALPPLRVSMHVYSEEPARRFAIIDGQRRREGDVVTPGLTLLEIRRDGLRFGWQARVLWVPR